MFNVSKVLAYYIKNIIAASITFTYIFTSSNYLYKSNFDFYIENEMVFGIHIKELHTVSNFKIDTAYNVLK